MIRMTSKANIKRIEETIDQLQKISSTDSFYAQNIINCNFDARSIAKMLFGKDNDHLTTLEDAIHLKLNDNRDITLQELDIMRKALLFNEPSTSVINSSIIDWKRIHPYIINVSKKKYQDGHYADSVESAFKEVNSRIKDFYKMKTGNESDGVDLMWKVFCSKPPLIILDDLATESGRNVQEGYGHIFAGSMRGIRNPSAHANLTISGEKAMHLLFLASLLMFTIDDKLK
jgi:uncharacterized protein (TIGR02391 family)